MRFCKAIVATLALALVSAPVSAAEVVWWVTEPGKDHAAKLVAEFEKENPDIKVKLQTNPYGGLQNKVLIALRSGIPPDVIEVQTSWIAPYVATGKLAEVGDAIAGKLDAKDFVPAAIQLVIWHARAVVGLEPESGKRLWHVPFDVKASLTAPMPRKVGDDGLFVTSFYNGSMLLKVGADSAQVVWKSKARGERPNLTTDLSSIIPTPVVEGDYIYGVCSYGQLRCLKIDNGERVWETLKATSGQEARWANAFLIPQEDRFFLFNDNGDLIIARLSPKGYEELSRTHLIDPTNVMAKPRTVVWMHPAFANKCVYARNDKEIVCVSLAK